MTADLDFRLRHRGDVQKNKRLPQMVVGAETATAPGTDDRARLCRPILKAVVQTGRPLLIVAEDIDGEAHGLLPRPRRKVHPARV
jgi:hypothetical protein